MSPKRVNKESSRQSVERVSNEVRCFAMPWPRSRLGLALSWGERLDILDAWSAVLGGVYAYLPLKRELYGFDVLR
jgi:hypothetical protein